MIDDFVRLDFLCVWTPPKSSKTLCAHCATCYTAECTECSRFTRLPAANNKKHRWMSGEQRTALNSHPASSHPAQNGNHRNSPKSNSVDLVICECKNVCFCSVFDILIRHSFDILTQYLDLVFLLNILNQNFWFDPLTRHSHSPVWFRWLIWRSFENNQKIWNLKSSSHQRTRLPLRGCSKCASSD